MRLQTLRLQGFKSFANRTNLEFREGVTAIIGSNGCGKSNIADAIRWVLGEQRASAMRGAKMEEVIFQGTARRRPLNFAEVSLVFDNERGRVPVPQTEIEVSRKVFREGGSDYSLNRTACRLRDVQSLLRDTGLGSNAYAIIEAGMIETLLSDRAEERRALFEEAAGIGRYKDSRQAATRRLEAASADLTRLDDLIAEVESKVRSLSRQRRRAERHRELRARRLDLEIAISRAELERLEGEIRAAEDRRAMLDETQRVAGAERSGADAVLEERRIEAAELGRKRTERAERMEAVRGELNARERDLLLTDERRSQGELRIGQLVTERADVIDRLASLGEEIEMARQARVRSENALERARDRAEARAAENAELRAVLAATRAGVEEAASAAREIAREIAVAEAERGSADRRFHDAAEQGTERLGRLEQVRLELAQMTDQTELWESEAEETRDGVALAEEALARGLEEVAVLRGRVQRARDEARSAEDEVARLGSLVEARYALEQSYEGFAPAVAAIMADRGRFPGVHGPLADYLDPPDSIERAEGIEQYLGALLHALVVEDLATARALRRWFQEEWMEGGALLILPLEVLSEGSEGRSLGARWVNRLVSDLLIVNDDPLERFEPGRARIRPGGEIVDARGVVRIVPRDGAQGLLARREALARLRQELEAAKRQHDGRISEREALRSALDDAEVRAEEARERCRVAGARLKGLELDAAAHRDRRSRLQEERNSLEESLRALADVREIASAEVKRLETRLEELSGQLEGSAMIEATSRERLAEVDASWDAAREEEAELRVLLARAEGDARDAARRLEVAEKSRAASERRVGEIDAEAARVRETLEGLAGARDRAAGELEGLFAARDRETGGLALIDARLAEVDSELAELGGRVRDARRRETEAAEARHAVDLELNEARSRSERVRERLEVEWGRPWAALEEEAGPAGEGTPDEWRAQLRETTSELDRVGPVNMLAMEEHEEEVRRLEFLETQRSDLVEARDNLVAAIREINRTAREVFESTFETVRVNFRRTFQSLFQGGDCDLSLADPDAPLESAVEIQASPGGKRTQRIHLLSGGERTLTALALLFALYLVKPSPFCVLDEVDAPLDESNVGRFIQLLNDFKHETQFIVITHNPRTMEAADWVYGVTMEEPGVSSIVGVELLGAFVEEQARAAS